MTPPRLLWPAVMIAALAMAGGAAAQAPARPARQTPAPQAPAQQAPAPQAPAQQVPAPAPQAPAEADVPLPYETELTKLSEVMGSLAFLRTLCTGAVDPVWREKMAALIDSEGRSAARKERLAGAYNRGYRGYALTYRTCTESAQEALVRLAREGETLARALANRFGG